MQDDDRRAVLASAASRRIATCGSGLRASSGRPMTGQRPIPALIVRHLDGSASGCASLRSRARSCPRARSSGSSSRGCRRRGKACGAQLCSTQVSFDPPPCDELTTSDPFASATRVSPPGTIVTFSPNSTYGRRSTWRGSIAPSMKQGAVDSAEHRLRDVVARVGQDPLAHLARAARGCCADRSACRSRPTRRPP